MVAILTPPADLESQRSLSDNPRKGESPPQPTDRLPFALDRALAPEFRSMDQNSHGFVPVPAASSFSFWAAASGKGTSAEGLSKPRLVKTRRRASSHAKPGFNPFQSGADRKDDDAMQSLPERFRGLNPFDNLPSVFNSNVSATVGPENSGSFESVNSETCNLSLFGSGSASISDGKNVAPFGSFNFSNADTSGFVFGAGGKKKGDWNKSSSIGSDENSRLLFQMSKANFQSNGNEVGDTTTMLHKNSGLNQSTMADSNEGLFTKLPEKMRKLNLQSSSNEGANLNSKVHGENFIFGSDKKAASSSQVGNTANCPPGERSDMNQKLSVSSDDGPFSKFPEETRKLNLKSSSNEQANHNSKAHGENFIFGRDKNASSSSQASGNVNWPPGEQSDMNQKLSVSSDDGPFSKLPEEMRKLNLKSSSNEQANHNSKVHGENFIFGSDKNASSSSQASGNVNWPPGEQSDMNQKLSVSSDDGPFSKLPEEMRKLNLKSSSNEQANHNSKVHGENFIFGSDKNASSSSQASGNVNWPPGEQSDMNQKLSVSSDDGPFSKLPEEMRKLNLKSSSNEQANHNSKVHGENFIFGSDKNASSSSQASGNVNWPPGEQSDMNQKLSVSSDDGPFSKLPEEMRKPNLRSSSNQNVFESAKEADSNFKVDGERTFIFGSDKNLPTSSQFGSSIHYPPDHSSKSKQKASLGSDDGPFSKLPEEKWKLNLQSSSSKIAFETTKEADRNSELVDKNASTSFQFSSSINFQQDKSYNSSQRTSHASDGNPFSTLQEETKKPNLHSSSNESAFETAKDAGHCSKFDGEKIFMFGSDKNESTSFKFVGSIKTDNYPPERNSNTSQKPCVGSDVGPFFKLPEEMKKLNLQSSSREHAFKAANEADHSYVDDVENVFSFGSDRNKSNYFQFGNSVNCPKERSSNMSQKSTRASEYGLPSKRPDVARKMNLQGLGNENGFGYTNKADQSQNFLASNGESISVLPDEMRKLNMNSSGNLVGLQNSKPSAQSSHTDDRKSFLFGSSQNESSSFGISTPNNFTEKMKANVGIETLSADAEAKSRDASSSFVFGSLNNISSSTGGSSTSTLPTDTKKFDINPFDDIPEQVIPNDSPMDASAPLNFQEGKQGAASNLGDIPTSQGFDHFVITGVNLDAHTPSKFSFQAEKQDAKPSMGTIPSARMSTDSKLDGVPKTPSPLSSTFHGFQSFKTEFSFGKMNLGFQTPHVEFKTPTQASFSFCENLFTGAHQNVEFGSKKGVSKATQLKKRRGKLRQSATFQQSNDEKFISRKKHSQDSPAVDSSGEYSPMDYSPYRDNPATDQYSSREALSASDESVQLPLHGSTEMHSVPLAGRDEDLSFAAQELDISGGDLKHSLDNDSSQAHFESSFPCEPSLKNMQNSEIGTASFMPETEGDIDLTNDGRTVASQGANFPYNSNIDGPPNEGRAYIFESHILDAGESKFTFSASSSSQGPLFSSKRYSRRKDRMKADKDLCNFTLDAKIPFPPKFPASSIPHVTDHVQGIKEIPIALSAEDNHMVETHGKLESRQRSTSTAAASIAAQGACENLRLRGNQAYANGHLSKAEEYYTQAINSVSPNETLRSCLRVLMLCYSNRAAARMSLGRMREALSDSLMAAAIDPNFLKAQVRAANCHLALGETEDAVKYFQKCLQSEWAEGLDHKIFKEASDGLHKAQLVADNMDQSENILLKRASTEAKRALGLITDALLISPYCEKLLEMKAELLLMMRKYDEVIELCEKTLDLAKKNAFLIVADGKHKDIDTTEGMKGSLLRPWRWHLISKSNFYLGKFDEALELLQKHEQLQPIIEKYGARSSELSMTLSVTISELLRLKSAGNEAFQAGKYSEAVECYTAALALNIESRPFTAICFCNRAAAYQALGQITDAIADCSLAIALDGSYAKAISRRATLHEMIRDYGQASDDLRRLISCLEKQSNKDDKSGTLGRSSSNASELKSVHLRLSMMEDESRKEVPLDMYLILGIESSSSEADMKKAYRKAALRHHPDKVSRFFVRSENVDEGFWKEVADEVRVDADRLFKLIHEAYTTLSDPTKRLQYDAEVEMRNSLKKGYNGSSKPKTPADKYSSQYEKSGSRRQWREGWKSYGSSQQRWSDSSHSSWHY
ncbi:hypothetical protein J5N97_013479 [Dioscorea zingiberensis]|uniref:J domain-containing protein n=1 Tax=Dioscorea zingiberensis TaxID=325984 RepID=A0A9D5CQN4_9LILI|nr:hypothetical protein J5N97_013479 [Dioscorea zingiberensis]